MSAKHLKWMTRASLTASLAVLSACVGSGDFCDVVRDQIEFAPETAAQVVRTDRAEAEQIAAQNAYWVGNCP